MIMITMNRFVKYNDLIGHQYQYGPINVNKRPVGQSSRPCKVLNLKYFKTENFTLYEILKNTFFFLRLR